MDQAVADCQSDDMQLGAGDALLIVDLQNDFLPGGRLAVPGGDQVVPLLGEWARRFAALALPVVATRDWHPPDHCSFAARGGIWPEHCVAGSEGAEFASGLVLPESTTVVAKATGRDEEAYSGFAGTGLANRLREAGVRRLFVGGLATDYCVLNTVVDALDAGFAVVVLAEAIRAVDVEPGDGERALARMSARGARIVGSAEARQ
ncbi:nicotinamidase [Accumulibacter sp.]|uniref:nicotinamidase n=1 Tax=Accumulibacter sp. TaxID=2053492 RepID=UPI0025F768FB|nr:nicotinamidase [Accumulibacter sp.]MCM8594853.1 nicotinamidase [Accumulibacter sp.]MCM8626017.1 nicotinamidase [Accumulibacter sp.]MDS4048999.1 nicotinamidase [Accumulibacter sp.]